jgi:PadR family transcriptional regulator, regulatory protein PadR
MPGKRTPSPQTMKVLHAMAADPARWRYGYDLGAETGLKAGSLYPILVRLTDRGLLEAMWEESPPHGRPARHLYRLTSEGLGLATAPDPAGANARAARAARAPRAASAARLAPVYDAAPAPVPRGFNRRAQPGGA